MAKKRANGEGTIFQRADGSWCAKLLIDGKRREFSGKTQAAVKRRLADAKLAAAQGLPVTPERLTEGAYLNRWLAESARPRVRAQTYASYEKVVRVHLIPFAKLTGPG